MLSAEIRGINIDHVMCLVNNPNRSPLITLNSHILRVSMHTVWKEGFEDEGEADMSGSLDAARTVAPSLC